mgnify:CR=1 FL=1
MAIIYGDNSSNVRAGKVININRYEWNTRTSVLSTSGGSTRWIYENTFNKLESTSTIVVQAYIQGWSNSAGAVQGVVYVGNQNEESGVGYQYTASSYLKIYHVNTAITNNTQTGTIGFGVGFRANNGGSNERPFDSWWNPSSSDDNRLGQSGSIFLVWEIMP